MIQVSASSAVIGDFFWVYLVSAFGEADNGIPKTDVIDYLALMDFLPAVDVADGCSTCIIHTLSLSMGNK